MASPEPRSISAGARRGKLVGQGVFLVFLVWIIASGSITILRETLFSPRVSRGAEACRAELALLRAHLADARRIVALHEPPQAELAAVASFRAVLGGESGRAWDTRSVELIDGCPAVESSAAYALARLRAADEAMVRLDAQQAAPARRAHAEALRALSPPFGDSQGSPTAVAASAVASPAPSSS